MLNSKIKLAVKLAAVPFVGLLIFILYNLAFLGRIYPGISIAGVYVGDKKMREAAILLSKDIATPISITLVAHGQKFEISLEAIDFSYDFAASAQAAYSLDRTGNILSDFWQRARAFSRNKQLGLRIVLDEEKLSENLSVVAGQVVVEPIQPSAKLVGDRLVVESGKAGYDVDQKTLRTQIGQVLAFTKRVQIPIPVFTVDPSLNKPEAEKFSERAEKFTGKNLVLNFEPQTFTYKENDLLDLLKPKAEFDEQKIDELISTISSAINREPENPTFVFEGKKVREFAPAKDGLAVKETLLKSTVIEKLRTLENSEQKLAQITIPTTRTPARIQTGDVNDLGIKELVGHGTSTFAGSISSRIYNITLSASRLNGILIEPGQTFSFNSALGDISKFTGYKEAFIIKDGKTILGDGGGVCQVSTTFFRAALDAGLPIAERRAHSYRVGYYEQDSSPGFDATVYAPTTDLKIINDTGTHILIQAHADTKNYTLVFEFYGAGDGRKATTTKPIVTSLVEPPEDLYQDDPTLPAGAIKQIDWKAWGAKTSFNYKVTRDGETVYQKTFYSNYRPWQAIYLRGTGPTN